MKISNKMTSLIKEWEGLSLKPYSDGFKDNQQQFSIGYGHQIKTNESSLKNGITKFKADELFLNDIKSFENAVSKSKRALNQNQFDALTSFAFNCGIGALSKVLATWEITGSVKKTIEHLKLYDKWTVNGQKVVNKTLKSRRDRESSIFESSIFEIFKEKKALPC